MSRNRLVTAASHRVQEADNLILLVVVVFVVTIIMLGISLTLYHVSGTAQLDLSRPGYEDARDGQNDTPQVSAPGFAASGEINDGVIDQFNRLLDESAARVQIDAFRPEPLSNETLGIRD